MATVDEMQAELAALKSARNSGALVVRKGDDMVTYRSLKEITDIIAQLEAEIAAATATTRVRRVRFHDKDGW